MQKKDADIIKLERKYYLLWVTPPSGGKPFEVSKYFENKIQPKCPTSPFCPNERIPTISKNEDPERNIFYDEEEDMYFKYKKINKVKSCPYNFKTKKECYKDINIKALKNALFNEKETKIISNYLDSLSYSVKKEEILEHEIDGNRILKSHGKIYNFHEITAKVAPGGIMLCFIREP